jgi:hypothetical protein
MDVILSTIRIGIASSKAGNGRQRDKTGRSFGAPRRF